MKILLTSINDDAYAASAVSDQNALVSCLRVILICVQHWVVNCDIQGRLPCRARYQSSETDLSIRRDAAAIDHCDLVVRFNDCRSVGEGGWRTHVVAVCNTGRPALSMIRQRSWRERPEVASASEIWCVRDGGRFAELKPQLDPALADFCDDYIAEFAMFAAETDKVFKVITRRHHERIDAELRSISSDNYVAPSSGLMAIAYVLAEASTVGDEIILAGFDHKGWEGHPFDAERVLIERYIAEGRLSRTSALSTRRSVKTDSRQLRVSNGATRSQNHHGSTLADRPRRWHP